MRNCKRQIAHGRRQGRFRRRGRGFSVLDSLIGASLLSITMLGLATILPTSSANVHRGGQNTKATALAQEMLETIRNNPFTQISLFNGLDGLGVDTRNPSNFPVDNPIPPVPGNPGNFQGGSDLTRWTNDIALFLVTGAGITGGYGTVRVVSVAQDPLTGNSILDKITVTVYWTEGGASRSVQFASLLSGI